MLEGSMTWTFPALFAQDKPKHSLPKALPRRSSAEPMQATGLRKLRLALGLTRCIDEETHAAGIAR
jgi:hypothetical protein